MKSFAILMACAAFAACEGTATPDAQPFKGEVTVGEVLTSEGVTVNDGPIYFFDAEGGAVTLPVSVTNSKGYEDHIKYSVETSAAWCEAVLADGVLSICVEPSGLTSARSATVAVNVTVCDPKGAVAPIELNVGQAAGDLAMDMAFVKAGTFRFGAGICCSNSDYNFDVKITRDFFMSTTEITQELYEAVMGEDLKPNYKDKFVGPNYPVHSVRWIDACLFCNKLSVEEGLTPAYTAEEITYKPDSWSPEQTMTDYVLDPKANGYRLPTSAEWEYAAKGGSEGVKNLTVYIGGNNYDDYCWVKENSVDASGTAELKPVALKKPNQLGLYDMGGNIEEWVYDWSGSYGATYPKELQEDWLGMPRESSNYKKMMRGSSYSSAASPGVKVVYTRYQSPTEDDYYQSRGFRVVKNAQ